MTFTAKEQEANFTMLITSITELKSGKKHTDDWEQKHFNFFHKIREHFTDFRLVHPDIKDPIFRDEMEEAEYYALNVYMGGDFDYNSYLEMLERVLYAVEYNQSDDELSSMMATVRLCQ